MNETAPLTDAEKRTRVFFASTAFVLLSVIIIALVYLATSTTTAAPATLSFAGGVPNIFLPRAPPLAFVIIVIVPMSMGMGYRKGLTMALLCGSSRRKDEHGTADRSFFNDDIAFQLRRPHGLILS